MDGNRGRVTRGSAGRLSKFEERSIGIRSCALRGNYRFGAPARIPRIADDPRWPPQVLPGTDPVFRLLGVAPLIRYAEGMAHPGGAAGYIVIGRQPAPTHSKAQARPALATGMDSVHGCGRRQD